MSEESTRISSSTLRAVLKRKCRRRGRGFKSVLKKAFGLSKRIAKSSAFKNLKAGIAELPGLVGKLLNNVKNNKIKFILDSDITKTGLDLAAG